MDYATRYNLQHLDLDTLAWENTNPPTRKPLSDSAIKIYQFIENNHTWVIEGCYSDLLDLAIQQADGLIFLNPGIETCIANCRNRPWEPHKYKSFEEQNQNLDMLLDWVRQYPVRDDEFSLKSHQKLFNDFIGEKMEFKSNDRNA